MKKSFFLMLAVLFLSLSINAQEKVRQQEVGLVFRSFSGFGLTYRTGTQRSLWRFQTFVFGGSSSSDEQADSLFNEKNTISFDVRAGKEFRKNIIEKLEFRYGGDVFVGYGYNKQKSNDISRFDRDAMSKNTSYFAGFNLMIGLNYIIKDRLVIGAELLPFFRYTRNIRENQNFGGELRKRSGNAINYGISNSSALLSVLFRF